MHIPKLNGKILQVVNRFALLYTIHNFFLNFCYLIQSLYKCCFDLMYLFTFIDGDVSYCFDSSSCFGRFCSCLLVHFYLSFLFAWEGACPSPDPIAISIDFRHFTAVFGLSVNHVGELQSIHRQLGSTATAMCTEVVPHLINCVH